MPNRSLTPRSVSSMAFLRLKPRKKPTPGRTLIVTCTGCRALNCGLRTCDTPAVAPFFGLRPAPSRLPPRLGSFIELLHEFDLAPIRFGIASVNCPIRPDDVAGP